MCSNTEGVLCSPRGALYSIWGGIRRWPRISPSRIFSNISIPLHVALCAKCQQPTNINVVHNLRTCTHISSNWPISLQQAINTNTSAYWELWVSSVACFVQARRATELALRYAEQTLSMAGKQQASGGDFIYNSFKVSKQSHIPLLHVFNLIIISFYRLCIYPVILMMAILLAVDFSHFEKLHLVDLQYTALFRGYANNVQHCLRPQPLKIFF